jgi:FkbM family methyltransferase
MDMVELPMANRYSGEARGRLQLQVHPGSETVSNFLRSYRVWQRPLTAFIAQALRPGDGFVDVGANIGYFSVIAASAVGTRGRVHSFEPDPENFALLERNRALNGLEGMRCHAVAVADRIGEAVLHRSASNRGGHSLLEKPGLAGELRVPVTRLDVVLADEPPPRIVKIDVQGGDLAVLEGMEGLLSGGRSRPLVILEFAPGEFHRVDPGLERFRGFLDRHGYGLCAFVANERRTVTPPRVRFPSLRAIYDDFVHFGEDAEFDVLLVPQAATGDGSDLRPEAAA